MTSLSKEGRSQGKKIIWISFIILDCFLHKTTQIEILRHLAERGNDVYLFALHSKKRFQIVDSDVHLISVPLRYLPIITPSFFALIVFIFIPFFVLIKRPKFVITEPGPSIFAFVWKPLLYSLNCKVILDIRSTPAEVNNFRRYLDAILFNISVAAAKKMFDGATVLTALMKREICDKFHIDPEFIGVWTSGVSTTLFEPEKYNGAGMRKKLGLTDKFIIFYHGDLTVYRGIIESIESIKILKSKCHDVVLFLLGSGPALPVLEKLIQKKGIQDKVIIHSPVDHVDVPKYITMCDVGIVPLPNLPDWRHQCPLKLLEYLAMKKVVIATDIPSNREIIGKSKCGIYISSVDPSEIAKAIIYAYNNKERLKEWGSCGRAIVNEKYSWRKLAGVLESYLLTL